MKKALEVVRYKTRNIYIKSQHKTKELGGTSYYTNLQELGDLVREGVDFTFFDMNGEWTEESLLIRIIISNEKRSKDMVDQARINKIIRCGGVRNYIRKLEKRI